MYQFRECKKPDPPTSRSWLYPAPWFCNSMTISAAFIRFLEANVIKWGRETLGSVKISEDLIWDERNNKKESNRGNVELLLSFWRKATIMPERNSKHKIKEQLESKTPQNVHTKSARECGKEFGGSGEG